ncbi:MAG: transglycosylase SLT domain-containing protein [Hyphomicrobiales bacterium]|nr:transglycosylase SLT domain-containing protein [Hyphomicrobiales bacterium]
MLAGVLTAATSATAGSARDEAGAAITARAVALEHGEGVARDMTQAAKLYCLAARLGDPKAQYNLGWMYANGRGVARDDALASVFFGLAAAQGDAQAQAMLRFVGEPVNEPPECLREDKAADYSPAEDMAYEPPLPAEAPPSGAEQSRTVALVFKLAPEYKVDARLAIAVIRAESGFNANARSPKNAQGLMQLIPETAQRFNVNNAFDPVQNIRGGLAYLRWLLAYFQGNVALVAAAYNAGERAVEKYGGIPPFPETRGYVKTIMQLFKHAVHPYDSRVTEPSPLTARLTASKP